MVTIGVDPSLNSTGICVNISDLTYKYFIITSHMTKKMKDFQHPLVEFRPYVKEDYKGDEYIQKEMKKTTNISRICDEIEKIILEYEPDLIQMEGVSYGSTGSAALVDLAGLNFCLRLLFQHHSIPYNIISPTSNKKFACGNGQAMKDVMIESWLRMEPHMREVNGRIKLDDVADAYFLAHNQA